MVVFLLPALSSFPPTLWGGLSSHSRRVHTSPFPLLLQCEAAISDRQRDHEVNVKELRTTTKMTPELLSGHIPPGHIPKPIVMPDYVA